MPQLTFCRKQNWPNPGTSYFDPWRWDVQQNQSDSVLSEQQVRTELENKYPDANYEILDKPRVYINDKNGVVSEEWANPDFMVIDRKTGNIVDIVDAKNGNGGLTGPQKALNERGGVFKGSKRSQTLPRRSSRSVRQIPKNSVKVRRTNCKA